ncbi:MAG: hypothetical protein K2M55_07195 [Muribaculaceae bacterium]|nr:hypothetical protein [Muribaculaceae bacterium]
MSKEIFSINELGKKVARLVNNRNLEDKAVKDKANSLNEKSQLIPAVVVDAEAAVAEGLEVVDFQSGAEINANELKNYVVLVDGNHRYQAHLNLLAAVEKGKGEYAGEFWVMYPFNDELSIVDMLTELNIATNPWKGGDYGKCAAIVLGEKAPEGVKAMEKLIGKGCNLATASLWIAFTKEVSKGVMVKAMRGKETAGALTNSTNIQRGLKLYEAAEKAGFSSKYLGSRNFIQWIIKKVADTNNVADDDKVEQMIAFLGTINGKEIEEIKGDKGGDNKLTKQLRQLDELWDKAQQN